MGQQVGRSSNSDVVSASELATYAYGLEQWRLAHGLGHESQNVASLERGEALHAKTAAVEVGAKGRFHSNLGGILI